MSRQAYKNVERRLSGGRRLTTDATSSLRMSRVLQRGTAPELVVRRACSSKGLRYTTVNRDLPGSPDLANRARRWAIFVHGCYWHRHGGCRMASTPKTNPAFWAAKFARNQERDASAIDELERLGYRVLVVWECETRNEERVLERIGQLSAHLGRE